MEITGIKWLCSTIFFSSLLISCNEKGSSVEVSDVSNRVVDSVSFEIKYEDTARNSVDGIKLESDDLSPLVNQNQLVKHDYYSLSYNESYEQAEWVAYHLKKEYVKNKDYQRPFFIEDPSVTTKSADWRKYKNSNYDKGHLCPAGDMEFSRKAYDATFFTSNISPQDKKFNSGIWNRLEQKVRYWAVKYDGVYVVTGGVLNDRLKTIGKEQVAVPEYFYKIIARKDKSGYKVIAFLMANRPSEDPLYEFVVSVDQIEKRTGINFFHQLNDTLEQKLESTSDYKAWSF